MTKLETDCYPEVCDCVAMKRKIQAEIFEETKHMTREEQRERLRKNSEEFWADIKLLRAELAQRPAVNEQ